MRILFSTHAWDDYLYWQRTDRKTLARINELIKATQRTPFEGLGKPEPLWHALAGFWSRRISYQHRMIYRLDDDMLVIAQLRYQY